MQYFLFALHANSNKTQLLTNPKPIEPQKKKCNFNHIISDTNKCLALSLDKRKLVHLQKSKFNRRLYLFKIIVAKAKIYLKSEIHIHILLLYLVSMYGIKLKGFAKNHYS